MTQTSRVPKWFVMLFPVCCLWALGATARGANTASFVKIDATTQGHWHDGTGNNRIYGGDGYWLINCTGGKSIPAYATVVDPVNSANTYAGSDSTAIKHLLRPSSATHEDGIWYQNNGASFTFEMTLSGKRQIAIYCWDWDGSNHSLKIEALDGDSSAVLDTQTTTDYGAGKYFVYLATGHLKFRVSGLSNTRPFASGLFFDTTLALLSNGSAGAVQVYSADISGTIAALGAAPTTMYLFWATNDCTNSTADWIANGGVSNLGSYAAGTTFTNTLSGLSSNTFYYFNHMASNMAGEAWASLGGSPFFRTLGGAPGINNGSGARPLAKSAVLSGALTNGSSAFVVMALWADGAVETNLLDFGSPLMEGAFATNVTGLTPGTLYHYRCFASNAYGTAWADTATNFSTYAAAVPSSGNVTWTGGAGGDLREWCFDANWLGGAAPTNPTAATVYLKAAGAAVPGMVEEDRTIGGLSFGESGTVTHSLNLGGHALTVAGPLGTPGWGTYTLTLANGTLRLGTPSVTANLTFGNPYKGVLALSPGSILDAVNVNSITIGQRGWGDAGYGNLDLRGASVAGGVMAVSNLYLYSGGGNSYVSAVLLDGSTGISRLEVAKTLVMGETYGGGCGYIGNPADNYRLPPNLSIQVGRNPGQRADMTISYATAYRRAQEAKLVASRGGTFTAYLNTLYVMRYAMTESGALAVYGTLDLSAMDSCLIDASFIRIAQDHPTPSSLDNQRGSMLLPQGVVTAGVVVVGSTTGQGCGLLSLSNTLFTVTNTFTLNTTASNIINVGSGSCGLDIQGTFADAGGRIKVNFLSAPETGATNWAIRIKGDAQILLYTLIGQGRLISTGTYSGKKAGVLYDPAANFTYYALADTGAFSMQPIALARDELTFEIAPGGEVVVGTNDVNNGSFDPNGRPVTITVSIDGGPEGASISLGSTGDYAVQLKATAGEDYATDTCLVHVVSANPGVTNALTWSGGASTPLMSRREWLWSGNWLQGMPPTNPTPAIISYATPGQAVTGRLESARTIGGLKLGESAATVNHVLDLNGYTLAVSGHVADAEISGGIGFKITNGIISVGTSNVTGNITLTAGGVSTLTVCPGAKLDAVKVGTLQLAISLGGWGTSQAILDLRGAEVVGGTLRLGNLVMHNGGSGQGSYIYLDGNSVLSAIEVTNSVVIGQTGGDSTCYIGNPVDQKLPPNTSLRIGVGPTQRGSLLIMRTMFTTRTSTAKLVATSGGSFTGYLSSLTLVKHDASIEAGNTAAQTGLLDLSAMASCDIDTQDLKIAPDRTTAPTNTDNLVGTLKLPPGTVVAGTVMVGGVTNSGVATLECSNTAFRVTNSITLHKTARVVVKVGGQASALNIDQAGDSALAMATATNGALRIQFTAPCVFPNYGLRWAGDHVAALQALQAAGKLVVEDGGLAPKTASIFMYRDATYIGPGPASGTVIMIR